MEHDEAVRLQMTEQYLLEELSPEAREEFEEHFFECGECAADVEAGSSFVECSRRELVTQRDRKGELIPEPVRGGWSRWFRPAMVFPVVGMFLAIMAYQNLVMFPDMLRASKPAVYPVASLSIGTFSSDVIAVPANGFVVVLRIPPQAGYSSYTASLYDPKEKTDGEPEWTVAVPSALAHNTSASDPSLQDRWAVRIPAARGGSGVYTLVVRGVTPSGSSEEVGRGLLAVQGNKL